MLNILHKQTATPHTVVTVCVCGCAVVRAVHCTKHHPHHTVHKLPSFSFSWRLVSPKPAWVGVVQCFWADSILNACAANVYLARRTIIWPSTNILTLSAVLFTRHQLTHIGAGRGRYGHRPHFAYSIMCDRELNSAVLVAYQHHKFYSDAEYIHRVQGT